MTRARRGASLIDILVAAAILGVGGIATLVLMSQNTARTRRALEDYWAHRVATADLGKHAMSSFGALEQRFGSDHAARAFFKKTDPAAKASGIPDSFRDSMKLERSMRFWRPATMPEIGYLESTISYVSADGAPREVRISKLVVQPRLYASSPLSTNPGAPERPGGETGAAAPADAGGRDADPGLAMGEPSAALEPDEPEDPVARRDYVDEVTEMVHDANHRGQLGADVHKLAATFQATAAGRSGRYDWTRIGGLSFDADYRLKLIDEVLAAVPVPDGTYAYTYREESFAVEHKPHPVLIYDLSEADGVAYLLARVSERDAADAWKIEGRTAIDLGFHRVTAKAGAKAGAKPAARATWARVWATRTRVYAFATRHDADGRLLPDANELTIRTLPEPVEGTALPQVRDPRIPGWVGATLDAIGVESAVTAKPDSTYDLRQLLGA